MYRPHHDTARTTRVGGGVPLEEARNDPQGKPIGARWVLCSKSDNSDPDVRARLVAQEVSTYNDDNFHVATPPLGANKLLFSQWATEQWRSGSRLKLSFIDVRKPYFNGVPSRRLYVKLLQNWAFPKTWLQDWIAACTGHGMQVKSGRPATQTLC